MTKASTKKGMAGKLLAAGCSLALAASLTPAAALTALAAAGAGGELDVKVYRDGDAAHAIIDTATAGTTLTLGTLVADEKASWANPKDAQSTLCFTPNATAEDQAWSVIAAPEKRVVSFDDIFKNAKGTGVGVTAAQYWQPGAKLVMEDNATSKAITLTYEQVQAATGFYGDTTKTSAEGKATATVKPGIAVEAGVAEIGNNSRASATIDAALGSMTTSKLENVLSIGLSDPNYDVANLAQQIANVATIDIVLPAQEYAKVPRIYGEDWNDTMNAVVNATTGFSNETDFVVASSNNYQDALTASGLAGALQCPLLLTDKDELTQQTADQITALAAATGAKVYVIGGPLAVSENVKTKINQLPAIKGWQQDSVVRLAGETASETSLAVYEEMAKIPGADLTTAFVATSIAFQDAMSISPYTYAAKIPVVLTGDGNVLGADAVAALEKQADASTGAFANAIILGGNLAVSSSVEGQLFGAGAVTVKRIGEETAWETSNAIAEYLTAGTTGGAGWTVPASAVVATGDNYLDALVASQYCAAGSYPLLLVGNGQGGDYCVTNYIDDHATTLKGNSGIVTIVGGPQAVSNTIAAQINKIIS